MPRQPIHLSVVALVVAAMAVTLGSLVPYLPPDRDVPAPATVWDALRLPPGEISRREVAVHLASFFAIGLLLNWNVIRRFGRGATWITLAVVLAFAFFLEWMQGLTQTRHTGWIDVVVNTAGAGGGAIVAALTYRRRDGWRAVFVKWDRRFAIAVINVGNVALMVALVRVHTGATLNNWDDEYPLVLANEATGDRPWHGTIAGLAIYDRALSRDEVADRSRRPFNDAAARADAVALYDFSGTPETAWTNRAATPMTLNWTVPDSPASAFDGRGLAVGGSTLIRTDMPPVEVYESVRTSRAFTIDTSVLPANMNQDGPARIVSLSVDPYHRNVTLSQSGAEIDLRVRTPRTGPNGYLIPMRTTGEVLARGWHQIAVVYDRGAVRLYVDGPPARIDIDLATVSTMIVRRQWFGSEVLAAVVLFLPISLMASIPWIHRRAVAAMVIGSASVAALPLIAFAVTAVAHGRDIAWSFVFAAIAVGAAGVTFGRALHSFSPSPASAPDRASADGAT
ncbi:MAG: VanZ family protein [Phycisphaerales bacterium]|nr:VanZ family protein [Phycisphaerales bacterium]